MSRRELLRPLQSLNRAVGKGLGVLESELRRPSRKLNLCGPRQARDFSIKWPPLRMVSGLEVGGYDPFGSATLCRCD